jgi:5'-nucleotidase
LGEGQEEGAEVVVALTHSKLARDLKLAKKVPQLDLILGGHDHEYLTQYTQPHGTLLVKSGNGPQPPSP